MATSSSDKPLLHPAFSPTAYTKDRCYTAPIEQAIRRAAGTLFFDSSGEPFHPYSLRPLPTDRREKARELLQTHTFYCSQAASKLLGKESTLSSTSFNQNQFYHAWIDGLLIGGNTGIGNAEQLLQILENQPFPKNSEIYSKLYLSLLSLSARGDFPKGAVEELTIKLLALGLYPNDNLAGLGTALHLACRYGYSRLAEALIAKSDAGMQLLDSEHKTPAVRLAEHLQTHPLNDALVNLKARMGQYYIKKGLCINSNPLEAFDQMARLQGFQGEQTYEIEPKSYQEYRARLVEQKVERNKTVSTPPPPSPKNPPTRLGRLFSKILGTSKEKISLPTVPENGSIGDPMPPRTLNEKMDYLETRFQYGNFPSQKNLFSHFLMLVTPISSPQWHLVERYCNLLFDYKDPYYDDLYAEIYFSLLAIIDFHPESANQARKCASIISKTGFDMVRYHENWKACAGPLTGWVTGWSPYLVFKEADGGGWEKSIKPHPSNQKALRSLAERNELIVQIAPTRGRSHATAGEASIDI